MALMMGALEYSIFPHVIKPELGQLVGIKSRKTAWEWVVCQIKRNAAEAKWAHAEILGKLAQVFPKIFFAMGRCKFPIYLTRNQADDWFTMWRTINETRMARNNWSFTGPNFEACLLYTSPSPRDRLLSRMPSSA